MQFRYPVLGLLLAAAFIISHWVWNQPGIPPVRLPDLEVQVPVRNPEPEQATTPFRLEDATSGEASAQTPDAEPVLVLPELNDSDTWLKEQLADLALPWLAETELIRTSATVLENAAKGEIPRQFLQFLAPEGRFSAATEAGGLHTAAASFARYEPFVTTLEMLPPGRAAGMFRTLEPLLGEAVRELGSDAGTPRELAYVALGVALATPRIDGEERLVQPKVLYRYADEELEGLLPLQKQLLRLGPNNLERVRLWLERFGVALSPGLADEAITDGVLTEEPAVPAADGPFVPQ